MENVYILQPVLSDDYAVLHEEAVALIESAGAAYAGTLYAKIREINPATFIGEGKLAELNELLCGLDVTVLFNGELSPSQTVNLSEGLEGKKVIDRTTLILDIFALRAESSEGKLQVELAQLRYLYPRLKGKGGALSRLGGGIGTRGPGETQLETDRRHIRSRIRALEEKLDRTEQRRDLLTKRRKKDGVRTIALVGYTNTGKSTLLNVLTGADVFVKDALSPRSIPLRAVWRSTAWSFCSSIQSDFCRICPIISSTHSALRWRARCIAILRSSSATQAARTKRSTGRRCRHWRISGFPRPSFL